MKWTDKYHPGSFDEVMGNKKAVAACRYYVEHPQDMPHLMFSGYTGVGKTTLAKLLKQELEIDGMNYSYKNCSDETSIEMIRKELIDFMRYSKWGDVPFKLVILEESEQLSRQAQQALKVPLERYNNCRVVFITNHPDRFIDEIRKGRCQEFRFEPLSKQEITQRLNYIIQQEGLTDIDVQSIAREAEGSMRLAISNLQQKTITGDKTSEIDQIVQKYAGVQQ